MGFFPFPAPLNDKEFVSFLSNCGSLIGGAELWDGLYRYFWIVQSVSG